MEVLGVGQRAAGVSNEGVQSPDRSCPGALDTFNPPGRGDMEFGNGVSCLDTLC